MKQQFSLAYSAITMTAVLFGSVSAYAADEPPKPTSAGDVGGNVKSFFHNLGSGVAVKKPYQEYDVVSRGIVPGRGPGYCLKSESIPHLESAPNKVGLALVSCKALEDAGQFQRVAQAGSAAPPTTAGTSPDVAADPSKQCVQHHVPVDNGTGDQYCMRKDGTVVGIVHYAKKTDGSGYDMTYEPLQHPVSIGILKAGGSVGRDGNVVLPPNVQAGWDNVDRIKDEGAARVKAETAASQSANADKAMIRKAAMEKCKPLIKGGDAQMTAFKACFKEATQ